MPGIRVHHPTETTCTFTLVDAKRPYPAPVECGACHKTHEFKTYHIDIDGEGFAIISTEIWEKLQRIPGQPFQLSNEVKKPPARTLAFGFANAKPKIVGLDGKEIRSGNL